MRTAPVLAAALSAAVASAQPVFDESAAIDRMGDGSSAAWMEDGVLHAIVRVEAESVLLLAAVQEELELLSEPDLWGGAFEIERADEAVMSCAFGARTEDGLERVHETPPIRGALARPPVASADPVRGTIETHMLGADRMGADREVFVYMPPDVRADEIRQVLYLADGQSVTSQVPQIEALVVSGAIPPTLVVGVSSASGVAFGDPSQDTRAIEYLSGFSRFAEGADPERFDKHWLFFTRDVPDLIEEMVGVTIEPGDRIVAGTSNGGAFAATVAALAPERFGASIVLSSGWLLVADNFEPLTGRADAHRAFFSAGVHEPRFLEQTTAASRAAEEAGYTVFLDERVGGHDPLIWREQLAAGLLWLGSPD
ncbi:MAG: alpha/beta hydrolase-fold protein [Planctomycetota bacterium]